MERYKLSKVIGEGSFGRALLVQCSISGEKCVLKEIQLPKTGSKLENQRKEAVLLSRMKHPNIVAFREAFEADGLLCIVMEYCQGGDLLQRIHRQKSTPFCVKDILRWFAQMCSGTSHIHEKRVLHRDLKSKNIFLTGNGTIKLGDFGSACVLNSSKAFARTYVGTPYYVAPEIWDNKPYNNKSDVWSLACVLYELCTLHHPFQASSWKSLILKVCRGAYPPLPRHLPYELHHVIKQMFKTDPKDRPSLSTLLGSHRVSKLLRPHLPSQAMLAEDAGGRPGRWRREDGTKVAQFLGQKSLLATSTLEGGAWPEAQPEHTGPAPRRQWAAGPSDSLVQVFANASLLSSDSTASSGAAHAEENRHEEAQVGQPRRRWDKSPPERLLRALEKAELSRASSTYVIHRGGSDPLVGPLSLPQSDDTDGPEQEVEADEDRLQPRSDDEDTDFEEESPPDWIDALEKMCGKQQCVPTGHRAVP